MPPVSRTALLAGLPPVGASTPYPASAKVVVLDDDPTGTQTVHGVPVLTTWDCAGFEAALNEPGPCFYILTNTRAFSAARASEINREIGENLAAAAACSGRPFAIVSRSDSTLRGHYPTETDALAAGLRINFNGTLIIPAFFAGGRITVEDVHYVADGDTLMPAGETEFARDKSFGYRASNLCEWVEEKTAGRILAADVLSISIRDLRSTGANYVAQKLVALPHGGVAVVNAAAPADLAVLTHALAAVERTGRAISFAPQRTSSRPTPALPRDHC